MSLPKLETERLILRAFDLSDAALVQKYAGHKLIAATTGSIPHPYLDGMAEDWIGSQSQHLEKNTQHNFAITLKSTGELIGCVGLYLAFEHEKAELGYWVGVDFWNQGYGFEAARETVRYAFEELKLNKITARHVTTNPASGKIMQKIGMIKEGSLRQNFKKFGVLMDEDVYGLLRSEYKN